MRRFETPPAPPGWTGGGATLIRIVDPLGGAIAWLAPDYGGACIGYAIRRDEGDGARWYQVLRASRPHDWRDDPRGIGIAILGPRAAKPDAASRARWHLVERDPTAATCAAQIDGAVLRFTARLEAAALHLDLRAESAARAPGIGLRLTFADDLRDMANSDADPSLGTGDGRLRIALATAGQERPRWSARARGQHAVEIWGESFVGVVIHIEE